MKICDFEDIIFQLSARQIGYMPPKTIFVKIII